MSTPTLCEDLAFMSSSTLDANVGTELHNYRVRCAGTPDEARQVVAENLPLCLDPLNIEATRDEVCGGEVIVAEGDIKIGYPRRWLSNIDISADASQRKGFYQAAVTYEGCNPAPQLSFNTGGGTAHIDSSLATTGMYGNACNFQGLIGVRHGGEVDGADIIAPNCRFTLSVCHDPRFLTCDRYVELCCIVGCTNLNPWDPYQGETPLETWTPETAGQNGVACFGPEELLFLGADGQVPSFGPQRINYHFEFSKRTTVLCNLPTTNVAGVTVWQQQSIVKEGHQILWKRYEMEVDGGCGFMVMLPEAAYTERVYPRCSYAPFANYNMPIGG